MILGLCYICQDNVSEGTPYFADLCLCKTSYLHWRCYLDILSHTEEHSSMSQNQPRCSICKSGLPGLDITRPFRTLMLVSAVVWTIICFLFLKVSVLGTTTIILMIGYRSLGISVTEEALTRFGLWTVLRVASISTMARRARISCVMIPICRWIMYSVPYHQYGDYLYMLFIVSYLRDWKVLLILFLAMAYFRFAVYVVFIYSTRNHLRLKQKQT